MPPLLTPNQLHSATEGTPGQNPQQSPPNTPRQSRASRIGSFFMCLLMIPVYTWFNAYETLDVLGKKKSTDNKETKLWVESKRSELNFVAVVGSLLASVIASSLSWPEVSNSPWIVEALWVTSIAFVTGAVVMAFQQSASLAKLLIECSCTDGKSVYSTYLFHSSKKPSLMAVFALQAPVQLLTYCFCSYSIGLMVHVSSKGFTGELPWRVSVFFVSAIGSGLFLYAWLSAYWSYALKPRGKPSSADDLQYTGINAV
ncbi:hypothetical protein FN846DRAFT_918330 [Sphaerosporella brunnea]|uniref:Uncharacterized protein n=1 Tax=Sphaerosporella brunnea TaxID=1250544 RepID=A0A5J5F1H0_9PEZI|nr:hypothetical protein FN846DRAFT_918330 [Sphaerosporella brunnea]